MRLAEWSGGEETQEGQHLHCCPPELSLLQTSSQTSLVSVGGQPSQASHHQGHLTLCCTPFLGPGWCEAPQAKHSPPMRASFLGRGGASQAILHRSAPLSASTGGGGGCLLPRHWAVDSLSHCLPGPPSRCLLTTSTLSHPAWPSTQDQTRMANTDWLTGCVFLYFPSRAMYRPISFDPHLQLRAGLSRVWKFELYFVGRLWRLREAVKGSV